MRVQITATAPTVYQVNTLKKLIGSLPYHANPDGSFVFDWYFYTKREAGQWLRERAYALADSTTELTNMIADISKYDSLTLDGITARIQRFSFNS